MLAVAGLDLAFFAMFCVTAAQSQTVKISINDSLPSRNVRITCSIRISSSDSSLQDRYYSINIFRCRYSEDKNCGMGNDKIRGSCLLFRSLQIGPREMHYCGCFGLNCSKIRPDSDSRKGSYSVILPDATCWEAGRVVCQADELDTHLTETSRSLEMLPGGPSIHVTVNRKLSQVKMTCHVYSTLPVTFLWAFRDPNHTSWESFVAKNSNSGAAVHQNSQPPLSKRCSIPWRSSVERSLSSEDGLQREFRCGVTYAYLGTDFTSWSPPINLGSGLTNNATNVYTDQQNSTQEEEMLMTTMTASARKDRHQAVRSGSKVTTWVGTWTASMDPRSVQIAKGVMVSMAVLVVSGLLCLTALLLTESGFVRRYHGPARSFANLRLAALRRLRSGAWSRRVHRARSRPVRSVGAEPRRARNDEGSPFRGALARVLFSSQDYELRQDSAIRVRGASGWDSQVDADALQGGDEVEEGEAADPYTENMGRDSYSIFSFFSTSTAQSTTQALVHNQIQAHSHDQAQAQNQGNPALPQREACTTDLTIDATTPAGSTQDSVSFQWPSSSSVTASPSRHLAENIADPITPVPSSSHTVSGSSARVPRALDPRIVFPEKAEDCLSAAEDITSPQNTSRTPAVVTTETACEEGAADSTAMYSMTQTQSITRSEKTINNDLITIEKCPTNSVTLEDDSLVTTPEAGRSSAGTPCMLETEEAEVVTAPTCSDSQEDGGNSSQTDL